MKKKEVTKIDANKEFLNALEFICKEKDIDKQVVIDAMELALTSAYKKEYGKANGKAVVNPETGEIKVYSYLNVVEKLTEIDEESEEINKKEEEIRRDTEITLEEARKINPDYKVGDQILEEVTPGDFGRVASSTAKQVVRQKIREAERDSIVNFFDGKEQELLIGTVELEDSDNYYIDLGKSNGILPKNKIIPGETIKMGSTIKVYCEKVDNTGRNLVVKLSRTHYGFVKRLFEHEIPEFEDGTLMMYSVAREPGVRSKVAVYSTKAGFEPIGACIGEKGARIAAIIKELGGEKIDIIKYDEDPKTFIENALSPAKEVTVLITDPKEKAAIVVADGDNFSLAIGKKGMNAKLASKLTKYRIDVKNKEQAREIGISIK